MPIDFLAIVRECRSAYPPEPPPVTDAPIPPIDNFHWGTLYGDGDTYCETAPKSELKQKEEPMQTEPRLNPRRVLLSAASLVAMVCIVLFFLAACSMGQLPALAATVSRRMAQASPTNAVEIAATATARVPQASPTLEQDHAATQLALVGMIATKQAELDAQSVEMRRLDLEIAKAQKDTAQKQAEAEKYRAAQKRTDLDREIAIPMANAAEQRAKAALLEQENKKEELAQRNKELEAKLKNANADVVLYAAIVALFVAAALTAFRVVSLRSVAPAAIQEPVAPPAVFIQAPDGNKLTRVVDPPGDPERFLRWCARALSGQSIAVDACAGANRPYPTHAAYQPVLDWAENNGFARRNKDNRIVVTPLGEQEFERRMLAYRDNPPPPAMDILQNDPISSHEYDNHERDGDGEEVVE